MLSINLDEQTKQYLLEISSKENTTSEEILKKIIYQHWQTLKPEQSIMERRGGHPQNLLENAPTNLSTREKRKKFIADYIQKKHQ